MDILLAKSAFGQWLISEQEVGGKGERFWSIGYLPPTQIWIPSLNKDSYNRIEVGPAPIV